MGNEIQIIHLDDCSTPLIQHKHKLLPWEPITSTRRNEILSFPLMDLGLRELTLMMIIFNYGVQTLQDGGDQTYKKRL